jgi:HPt (histidine-containing phosphotransfer) domain-containing protein
MKCIVHDIKGTSGNFGFIGLSEIAAKLEFQIMNKNKYEVHELLQTLEAYCQRIIAGKAVMEEQGLLAHQA